VFKFSEGNLNIKKEKIKLGNNYLFIFEELGNN